MQTNDIEKQMGQKSYRGVPGRANAKIGQSGKMAYFQLTVGGHVDCVFSEEERRSKNSFAILGSLLLRLICFLKHLFLETPTSGGRGSLKRKKRTNSTKMFLFFRFLFR